MNKQTFLKNLESNLLVLAIDKRNKIVDNYEKKIDKMILEGAKEEDALKEIGSVAEIAKKELSNFGIDANYVNGNKKSYFGLFLIAIDNFVAKMSKKETKEVVKTIGELLIVLLIVALTKIPFIFIKDLAVTFLELFQVSVTDFAASVISVVIEATYLVTAVVLFISIFKKRFGESTKN